MARSKDNETPEAEAEGTTSRIPAEEIAELLAEREKNDLEKSGRVATQVETLTVVEDRTDEPADILKREYHAEKRELDNGTILTSYGEAK